MLTTYSAGAGRAQARENSRKTSKGNSVGEANEDTSMKTETNGDMEGPKKCIVIRGRGGANSNTGATFNIGTRRKFNKDMILAKELQMMFFPKFRYETRNFDSTLVRSGDYVTSGATGSGKAAYWEMYYNPVTYQSLLQQFAASNVLPTLTNAANHFQSQPTRDQLLVTSNKAFAELTNPTDRAQNVYYMVLKAKKDHGIAPLSAWAENIQRRLSGAGGGTAPDPAVSVYEWGMTGPALTELWDVRQTWTKIVLEPGATHTITLNFGKAWWGERSTIADNNDELYSRNTFCLCCKAVGMNVIDSTVGSSKLTTGTVSIVYHGRQQTEYHLYRAHQQRMTRWMADNQISQSLAGANQGMVNVESNQEDGNVNDLAL